jgi:hypothetical protein
LILFYLVFQVNYMSLAENWNGKGKKNHTVLANDRSTSAIVHPGEHAPQLDERALGERLPRLANVRTRGHLTRQARGQLKFASSSLQVEVGDQPTALIRVLGFLGFPSVYK